MIEINRSFIISMTAIILMASMTWVAADDFTRTEEKIKAALKHERRPAAERLRDSNRKPVDTLRFVGLRDDMTVLELLPGGGWYTKILGPVLEDKGKLYLAIGADRASDQLAGKPGFGSMEILSFDKDNVSRPQGSRRIDIKQFSFGVTGVDMVLTFRNMHNLTESARSAMNTAVFKALKSAGVYGVIDHTRRHMQADYDENWRRMDPVQMIKEVQAAGFEFVDYSSLHYRPDDELQYEVGRKTVTGNTDRFTLLFRKP